MPYRDDRDEIGLALARVADAGDSFLGDRIDLLRVEAAETAERTWTMAAGLGLVATLLVLGWLGGMAALVVTLVEPIGLPLALTAVAVPHQLVGIVLLGMGRSRYSQAAAERARPNPDDGRRPRWTGR